jgi:hypothetical protein
MDTIVLWLLLLSGRHPGEPARSYREIPAIGQGKLLLWQDPGQVPRRDFRYGVGGRHLEPEPPFTFIKEDTSGTSPKMSVRDGRGRNWVVRFGPKAGADVFASRLAWAVGYFVEPNYFVKEGTIVGAHDLHRTRHYIGAGGQFTSGRFQLRSAHPEFLKDVSWSWDNNPFLGTHELQGLKIMMMILSGWDNKDLRNAAKLGANTHIFRDGDRYLFLVDDWGRTMGGWGSVLHRSTWKAGDYYRQTPKFIKGVKNGELEFGYKGHNTEVMKRGITIADVRWLLRYLDRVTDAQIREGLRSSGASPEEAGLFTGALRARIGELQAVAGETAAPATVARAVAAR